MTPDILQAVESASDALAVDHWDHRRLDLYYDGEQELRMLGLDLPPQMHGLRTAINWPRLVVDAIAERMVVEGFRLAGTSNLDSQMWDWWQLNNLDEESRLGHVEALVQGKAYVTVGLADDGETPLVTVESRRNLHAEVDQRTKTVTHAVRLSGHREDDWTATSATVYLPDRTVYLRRGNTGDNRWTHDGTVEHQLGVVPVVPLVNRARLDDRNGRSEMQDIIPLTDSACRAATVLQGAQEILALPQRYVFGADADDFRDPAGNPVPKWTAYLGRLNALTNEKGRVEQLSGADLRQFTDVLTHYGRQVAALSGLPPHFLGLSTENPESADAIRSGESRLVMRTRDRSMALAGAWEQVMRLSLLWVTGGVPDGAERLEVAWRSPETPTFSAKADAVVKLVSAGVIPPRGALEELGYGPEQISRWEEYRQEEPLSLLASQAVSGRDT